MGTIAVLGAEGQLGRAVVARLRALKQDVRALGRGVDAQDQDAVGVAVSGATVVVAAAGVAERAAAATAAVRAGAHLLDAGPEQHHLRWLWSDLDAAARCAGVAVVPAAGVAFAIGDLLGNLAAGAAVDPDEVHVAYLIAERRLGGRSTAGLRTSAAALLGRPGVARVDGELVEEWPAEARRLAWFARPVGPHHAAGVPGGECFSLPTHVPTAVTVRTYLALPTLRAELLQLVANASRLPAARRLLEGRLLREARAADRGAARDDRAGSRWACVAEARGQLGVARAWANGRGVHDASGALIALLAARLANPDVGARDAAVGTVSPAHLVDPAEALDELSLAADLRWSVIRPET